MKKPKAPEYFITDSLIIPVENISHFHYPDDTLHVWLRNGREIWFKFSTESWIALQKAFTEGFEHNETAGSGKE